MTGFAWLLLSLCIFLAGRGHDVPVTIDRIAWLQGCWRAHSPTHVIEENWMAPLGGAMLGVGRTVRRDSLAEFELIVLRERDGALAYEAHPRLAGRERDVPANLE